MVPKARWFVAILVVPALLLALSADDVPRVRATPGTTQRASISTAGVEANDRSEMAAISGDGTVVAFQSWASNLVAGDTNSGADVFVRDLATGITERVSVDSAGNEATASSCDAEPSLSDDARYVAFASCAPDLVSGDLNGSGDIFVHDRQTGVTERVSVTTGGAEGNDGSFQAGISGDGNVVAFGSDADNFDPPATGQQLYIHDRSAGTTTAVGAEWTFSITEPPELNYDGSLVVFSSTDAALGVPIGDIRVFLYDRIADTVTLVSESAAATPANGRSIDPSVSDDGRYVAFSSNADNLIPEYSGPTWAVWVKDMVTGDVELASVDSFGAPCSGFERAAVAEPKWEIPIVQS